MQDRRCGTVTSHVVKTYPGCLFGVDLVKMKSLPSVCMCFLLSMHAQRCLHICEKYVIIYSMVLCLVLFLLLIFFRRKVFLYEVKTPLYKLHKYHHIHFKKLSAIIVKSTRLFVRRLCLSHMEERREKRLLQRFCWINCAKGVTEQKRKF